MEIISHFQKFGDLPPTLYSGNMIFHNPAIRLFQLLVGQFSPKSSMHVQLELNAKKGCGTIQLDCRLGTIRSSVSQTMSRNLLNRPADGFIGPGGFRLEFMLALTAVAILSAPTLVGYSALPTTGQRAVC